MPLPPCQPGAAVVQWETGFSPITINETDRRWGPVWKAKVNAGTQTAAVTDGGRRGT